jgi:hypothetical protein
MLLDNYSNLLKISDLYFGKYPYRSFWELGVKMDTLYLRERFFQFPAQQGVCMNGIVDDDGRVWFHG